MRSRKMKKQAKPKKAEDCGKRKGDVKKKRFCDLPAPMFPSGAELLLALSGVKKDSGGKGKKSSFCR